MNGRTANENTREGKFNKRFPVPHNRHAGHAKQMQQIANRHIRRRMNRWLKETTDAWA